MNVIIQNDVASATCQTHGAELISYRTAGGKEYMWQKDAAYWAKCAPTLFPYVGPVSSPVTIRGAACGVPRHGFVKDVEFEIEEKGSDYVVLKTAADADTRAMYPYAFSFTVTFRLRGAVLDVIYGVSNAGKEEMPFLIGGHPGFFCPMEEGAQFTDYVIHFEGGEREDVPLSYPLFDNDAIFFEDLKQRSITLVHKDTKKGLRFAFSDYPSVAFWTPIGKEAPFLCIEPWCAGTLEQVPDTEMTAKKYVQYLSAGASCAYRFSFAPC